jgi:hypothetical protein
MTEYFYPNYPTLYRIGGEYMAGLANLFEAHKCLDGGEHDIKDGKCTKCSVHVKEKNT